VGRERRGKENGSKRSNGIGVKGVRIGGKKGVSAQFNIHDSYVGTMYLMLIKASSPP